MRRVTIEPTVWGAPHLGVVPWWEENLFLPIDLLLSVNVRTQQLSGSNRRSTKLSDPRRSPTKSTVEIEEYLGYLSKNKAKRQSDSKQSGCVPAAKTGHRDQALMLTLLLCLVPLATAQTILSLDGE